MEALPLTPQQAARIILFAEILGVGFEEIGASVVEAGIATLDGNNSSENNGKGATRMSKQQQLVFSLLREGNSVKEIASELQLGEASVRTHIARIKAKLDCPDLLELRMRAGKSSARASGR